MKLRGNDFFIFLLPVYFVFHNYTTNFPSVSIPIALTVLFRYLFIAVLLYIVFYFVFKQRLKAAVFTFSVLAVQLFFGPFHDGLKSLFGGLFITRYSFLIPLLLLVLIVIFFYLKKSQKKFNRIASYLSVVLLVFILIDVFMLMSKAGSTKDLEIEDKSWQAIKCDTCTKNDIYLIIADEYAGNTELKELMKFDNSHFESALQKRGFYVVPNSISNYNYTPFSVASILSMEYLQGITKQSNKISNRSISYEKINNNTLIKTLSDHGYSFFNLSLFDFAGRPTQADNMFFLTREKLITGQTFTQRVNTDIGFNLITRLGLKTEMKNLSEKIWETNVWILNQTKKIASNKSGEPKFVYTHLNMPHYPYFFDRNGKPYPVETLMEGYQHRIEPYTEYLQYCNTIFIDLIDHIIKTSKQPPIIIFMGDHGFRHFEKPVAEKYHFMNMNAIYFPDKNYASFYEGMSAVNLFRIVMNTQFNQKLPLLKDSTSFMVEY